VSLGQKVSAAGESFQIEELVFDQPLHGFHVALVGVRGGRDAQVLAAAQFRREAGGFPVLVVTADEFRAVVGLPGQIAE
jgi:hypothetical protein